MSRHGLDMLLRLHAADRCCIQALQSLTNNPRSQRSSKVKLRTAERSRTNGRACLTSVLRSAKASDLDSCAAIISRRRTIVTKSCFDQSNMSLNSDNSEKSKIASNNQLFHDVLWDITTLSLRRYSSNNQHTSIEPPSCTT